MTERATESKRSTGITLLCFLLGWLSIAGLGNAWVILTGRVPNLPVWVGGIALCYGIAAGSACIGLWRMRYWGFRALRVWMCVCGLLLVSFVIVFPGNVFLGGYWGVLAFLTMFGGLLFALDRYVGKRVRAVVW